MDAAVDHFATVDTNYFNRGERYYSGIVVFEAPSDSKPAAKDEGSSQAESSSQAKAQKHTAGPILIEAGKIFVSEKEVRVCHICKKPGHTKADCPDKAKGQKCRKCNQTGHIKADCPSVVCGNCRQNGHIAANCTNATLCLKCGESGHRKSECPNKSGKPSTEARTCNVCGDSSHIGYYCPEACSICKESGHAAADCRAEIPQQDSTAAVSDKSKEKADQDNKVPGPSNLYQPPSPGHLDVVLTTQTLPQHGSSIEVNFRSSYESDQVNSGRACNSAHARFTPANITSPLTVKTVDEESPDIKRLLRPETREHIAKVAADKGADTNIHHLQFTTSSQGAVLGLGMFSERQHGPNHTALIHSIRDLLLQDKEVTVHFFMLSSSDVEYEISVLQATFTEQANNHPLLKWWKHGKVNPQKGMQLERESRPTEMVPAREQYDDYTEFMTMNYYGAIGELESVVQPDFVETTGTLVPFRGDSEHVNVLFVLIQQRQNLDLRPDDHIKVAFFSDTSLETNVWTGRVLDTSAVGDGFHYEAIIRRPHDKGNFSTEPQFSDNHFVKAADFGSMAELKKAIETHRGVKFTVQNNASHSNHDKEIKTLNHIHQNRAALDSDISAFLNNDWISPKKINFFARDIEEFGEPAVTEAWKEATTFLNLEGKQLDVENLLRNMPAGYGLLQGTGGTGKTTVFIAIALYRYILTVLADLDHGRVWTTSPLNGQLDDLSRKYFRYLNDWRKKYEAANPGKTLRQPVVVRYHMRQTERAVLEDNAQKKRTADGQQNDPFAVDEELNADLTMALFFRQKYDKEYKGIEDKRLRVVELSEATWMLRLAGVPDSDGNTHRISDGHSDRYRAFRDMLDQIARGAHMTDAMNKNWTTARNRLALHLKEITDVRLTTLHVAAETSVHSDFRPRILLVDEAGKAGERGLLNAIVFRQPYTQQGANKIDVDTHEIVPVLLAGDVFQPRSVIGPDMRAPFHPQTCKSTFQRMLDGGAPAVWLTKQHRYHEDIASIINAVLPNEPIETHPDTANLAVVHEARLFIEHAFGVQSQAIFVSLKSEQAINPYTSSRFNIGNAKLVLYLVNWALTFGIAGKDIGIATPYVSQIAAYKSGLYALKESFQSKGGRKYDALAKAIDDISIFTFDGIQGQEQAVIFMDTVITADFGFMQDTTRWLLALTRPRAGLIVVGDERTVAAQYTGNNGWKWKKSAYCKTVAAFMKQKWYIRIDDAAADGHFDKFKVDVDVGATLASVYAARAQTEPPFDFEDPPEKPPPKNLPFFAQDASDSADYIPNDPHADKDGYEVCLAEFSRQEPDWEYDDKDVQAFHKTSGSNIAKPLLQKIRKVVHAMSGEASPATCHEFLKLHGKDREAACRHLFVVVMHAKAPGLSFDEYDGLYERSQTNWNEVIEELRMNAPPEVEPEEDNAEPSGFGNSTWDWNTSNSNTDEWNTDTGNRNPNEWTSVDTSQDKNSIEDSMEDDVNLGW